MRHLKRTSMSITICHLKTRLLGAKYLLNFAKYVMRTIKEGTCDDWKREMFEWLMDEKWMDEHTVGRKKHVTMSNFF